MLKAPPAAVSPLAIGLTKVASAYTSTRADVFSGRDTLPESRLEFSCCFFLFR